MEKQKTVWVVEHGRYSDYRVVGVFSSKRNATLVADAINAGDNWSAGATVDEWPIDPAVDALNAGHSQFIVTMRRDGTTERCEKWETSSYYIAGHVEIWRRSTAPAYAGTGVEDCLSATVWAKDEAHAVKIVNEKRVQMIASGEWP